MHKHKQQESLYRTRWLMAHNRLHEIVHNKNIKTKTARARHWNEYLEELKIAKNIAAKLA